MKFKTLISFLGIFSTFASFASGWTEEHEITQLYLHSTNEGLFISQPQMINPDNCGRTEWYFLAQSHIHYQEMYSILLTAKASKTKVALFVDGCTATGWPSVVHIKF